jgi:hypothetical protein
MLLPKVPFLNDWPIFKRACITVHVPTSGPRPFRPVSGGVRGFPCGEGELSEASAAEAARTEQSLYARYLEHG